MESKIFDPQVLGEAEKAIQNRDFKLAIYLAESSLGGASSKVATLDKGVLERLRDSNQRLILACLARIEVDALKSLANSSVLPWQILPSLERAADFISGVYHGRDLRVSLMNVSEDHLGRPHHFLVEMARDEAKVVDSASVLFGRTRAERLRSKATHILETAYNGISENHPVKPLIGIEQQLLAAKYGDKLDVPRILDDLSKLVILDLRSNPERVVTIASQLMAWGQKRGQKKLSDEASYAYFQGTLSNTNLQGRFNIEKTKIRNQRRRSLLTHVLLPGVRSESRNKLYASLINETDS